MKKNWSFLVGASLVTGIVSSLFFKNKQKTKTSDLSEKELYSIYTGKWWFINKKKATQHTLEIEKNLSIFVDQKKFPSILIELNKDRLVVQDEFGYHLIVQCEKKKPTTLYDEADDITYKLEAIDSLVV